MAKNNNTLTPTMRNLYRYMIACGGTVICGSHSDGPRATRELRLLLGCRVSPSTMQGLERRGLVTTTFSPDGGMMGRLVGWAG